MKTIYILLLTLLIFTACKKKEDITPSNSRLASVSKGYMTATVGGTIINFDTTSYSVDQVAGTMTIQGYNINSNGFQINIYLPEPVGVGIHKLGYLFPSFAELNNPNPYYVTTDESVDIDQVNIITSNSSYIEGTFKFMTHRISGKDSIAVTNGSFKVYKN